MNNVAIFGVPRSGTSWLGQIFNSSPNVAYRYQPIFAYSFPEKLSAVSSPKEIDRFQAELLKTDDPFVCQRQNISGNKTPSFNKDKVTHLVWKEVRYLEIVENLILKSPIKIIGILRHPCGVLSSWMKAPKEFNEEWDIREEWRYAEKKNKGEYDYYGYERWLQVAQMFLRVKDTYPKQFKTVAYESLLQEPEAVVKDLFDFAELKVADQTQSFLIASTRTPSEDPYDVYRAKKTGREWKTALPPEITEKILSDDRFQEISAHIDLLN